MSDLVDLQTGGVVATVPVDCAEGWNDLPKAPLKTEAVKDQWETPLDLFDRLDGLFHFNLDAAADATNYRVPAWLGPGHHPVYFSPFDDALTAYWAAYGSRIFCNPPYSKIDPWIDKMIEARYGGATVVALLPANTDTKWFRKAQENSWGIAFIYGRLTFHYHGDKGYPARTPSVLLLFTSMDEDVEKFRKLSPIAWMAGLRG